MQIIHLCNLKNSCPLQVHVDGQGIHLPVIDFDGPAQVSGLLRGLGAFEPVVQDGDPDMQAADAAGEGLHWSRRFFKF